MSDPVTNADIEDVLAQVRRLVLQAAPPDVARIGASARATAQTRLVLTPALRVGEAEGSEDEAPPGASHVNGPAPRPATPRAPAPEPPLLLCDPLAGKTRRAQEAKGIEAALGAGAWEPDGSEPPDRTLGGLLDEGREAGAPPVLRRRVQEPARAEPAAPPAIPSATSPSTPAPAPAPAPPLAGAEGPPALDEGRLRALVVEVVRAELQGELGERVTRNIRKLVRSEVFRALGSRQEP